MKVSKVNHGQIFDINNISKTDLDRVFANVCKIGYFDHLELFEFWQNFPKFEIVLNQFLSFGMVKVFNLHKKFKVDLGTFFEILARLITMGKFFNFGKNFKMKLKEFLIKF